MSIASAPDLAHGRLLTRNLIWNLAGRGIPLLAAVGSLPILLHRLGPERFGILSLALSLIVYFTVFDLGIGRALTASVSRQLGKGSAGEVPGLFWSALALLAGLGALGATLITAAAPILATRAFHIAAPLQAEARSAFMLLAWSLPFLISSAAMWGILSAYQRFDIGNAINIPIGLVNYICPVVVALWWPNLAPIAVLLLACRITTWAIYLTICVRLIPALRSRIGFDAKGLSALVRSGGWMTVSNFVMPLILFMDRFVVGSVISVAAVGYYAGAYEIASKLWVIPIALTNVLFPAFSYAAAKASRRVDDLFRSGFLSLLAIVLPPIAVLAAFAPGILTVWLGGDVAAHAASALRIMGAGMFCSCMAHLPLALLQSQSRGRGVALLQAAGLVIYLPVLTAATALYGLEGAALAWSLRAALDAVLLYGMVLASGDSSVAPAPALGLGAVSVGIIVGCTLPEAPAVRALLLAVSLAALFGWLWCRALTSEERQRLTSALSALPRLHRRRGARAFVSPLRSVEEERG